MSDGLNDARRDSERQEKKEKELMKKLQNFNVDEMVRWVFTGNPEGDVPNSFDVLEFRIKSVIRALRKLIGPDRLPQKEREIILQSENVSVRIKVSLETK